MSVRAEKIFYSGAGGERIAGFRWTGAGVPKAILQLAHGAGEHSMRYLAPLTPLIEAGYVVYSADHRGHGETAGLARLGDFGPGGAPAAIEDMAVLSKQARAENPGLPLILMGHSMGSLFAQVYVLDHASLIDALVLSGTAAWDAVRPEGGPNAGYANPRTDYDWLSRDEAEVDAYIADPFCGIRFTPESAKSFFGLGPLTADAARIAGIPKDLPIYIFVGDKDPVNDDLKRLGPLVRRYRDAGLGDVTVKVYPGGRHEMLNEINRDEVVADLRGWLDSAAINGRGVSS